MFAARCRGLLPSGTDQPVRRTTAEHFDARVSLGMAVAFLPLSVLGIVVFFNASDAPVAGVFIGLTGVYAADIAATIGIGRPRLGQPAERAVGFFRLGTGLWLIYLVWAVVLNFIFKWARPL